MFYQNDIDFSAGICLLLSSLGLVLSVFISICASLMHVKSLYLDQFCMSAMFHMENEM